VVIRFSATLFVVIPNAAVPNAAAQNVAVQNAVAPNVARVVTPVVQNVALFAVIPNAEVRLVASPVHDDLFWECLEGEFREAETQVPKLAPVVRCAARV